MLVNCPDCSSKISTLACICPKCGYPVGELGINVPDKESEEASAVPGSENDEAFQRTRFEAKFRKVSKQLQVIREESRCIVGWIFRRHKYPIEELLKSEHFTKIDSVVGKIDDDAKTWIYLGSSTPVIESTYSDVRKHILKDISDLKQEIADRKPTLWEYIVSFLKYLLLSFRM